MAYIKDIEYLTNIPTNWWEPGWEDYEDEQRDAEDYDYDPEEFDQDDDLPF